MRLANAQRLEPGTDPAGPRAWPDLSRRRAYVVTASLVAMIVVILVSVTAIAVQGEHWQSWALAAALLVCLATAVGALRKARAQRFSAVLGWPMIVSQAAIVAIVVVVPQTGVVLATFVAYLGIGALLLHGIDARVRRRQIAVTGTALPLIAVASEWRPLGAPPLHAGGDVLYAAFVVGFSALTLLLLANIVDDQRLRAAQRRAAARRERELQVARAYAEGRAQAQMDFVATMSHELRTPLHAVVGLASLLRDANLDVRAREDARLLGLSADHLLTIVDDVLDLAKLDADAMTAADVEFDLLDVLESAVAIAAAHGDATGLDVALVLATPLPPAVRGDPGRLQQVLLNLLSNAVRYTDAGEVVVEARVAEPTATTGTVTLHLEVSDTGTGIAPEQLEALFDPFAQGDATRGGGTGLGLAISRRLTNLMGGRLEATSTPGRGATFLLDLPLAVVADRPARRLPPATRVLVRCARPATRRALVAGLTALGARAIVDPRPPDDGVELAILDGDEPRTAIRLAPPVRPSALHAALLGRLEESGPPAPAPDPTGRPLAETHPRAILVADDSLINQVVTARLLRRLGYEPDLAGDGREVLQRLAAKPYELIFMDLRMPKVDGLEATRRIRRSLPADRQPWIVGLSASVPEDAAAGRDAGFDAYIAKPATAAGLADAIVRSRRRPASGRMSDDVSGSPSR